MKKTPKFLGFKLHGLIAAPFTPFKKDYSVNLTTIDHLAIKLQTSGISGVFVNGTTGEGVSLSIAERKLIAQKWIKFKSDSFKILIHVGHNSLPEAQELARHAEKIGADAVGLVAPNFFKPSNLPNLVDFCRLVASEAPATPFYFYHMPAMTGVVFPMIDLVKLAGEKIPNFNGVKFTHSDFPDYARCIDFEKGRFDFPFGRDESLLPGLCLGASSAIGSTYNYSPHVYLRLIKAFQKGDLETARQEQLFSIKLVDFLNRFGGLPTGKALMKLTGVDCGPMRPPLRELSEKEITILKNGITNQGLFDGKKFL